MTGSTATRVTGPPAARPVSAAVLRRRIRNRRAAAGGGVSLDSVYVVALTIAVAVAIFGPKLVVAAWPDAAVTGPDAARAIAVLGLALLGIGLALRHTGPVAIGRADAAWLLSTPVARRGLLLPAFLRSLVAAALAGALIGLAGAGNLAARPTPTGQLITAASIGAATGVLLASAAAWAQRRRSVARVLDLAAVGGLLALAAVLLDDGLAGQEAVRRTCEYAVPPGWLALTDEVTLALTIGLAGVATVATAAIVGTLGRLRTARIQEAATTIGTYLDSAYASEPSFLSARNERRYWSDRALRSVPLRRLPGLPALVRQDLLVLRRSGRRLIRIVGAVLLPALVVGGPGWLLGGLFLVGALCSASATMDAVRRDAEHPAMLRLLGLTGLRVVAARLLVPATMAGLWSALALAVLSLLGHLPPGPWWALGLALGPTVGVAAVHRSRAGKVQNDLPLVDTPMGSISPGPVMWLLTGPDLLVPLALPALVALVAFRSLEELTWNRVLIQVGFSVVGVLAYLRFGADRRRSQL